MLLHLSGLIRLLTITATPLLAFCIMKRFAIVAIAADVFTEDNVIIVCFSSVLPLKTRAIIVPIAVVIPGTIDTKMPDNVPVIVEIIEDFFSDSVSSGSMMVWDFISVLDMNEDISVENPKRPARAGKRGVDGKSIKGFSGSFSTTIPYTPDKIKTATEITIAFFVFSVRTIIAITAIKIHGIRLLRF